MLLSTLRLSGGEFPSHLSVYPQLELNLRGETVTAGALNALLKSRCLIADDSVNPFTWTLVDADGGSTSVSVDPASLDRNELTLFRSAR